MGVRRQAGMRGRRMQADGDRGARGDWGVQDVACLREGGSLIGRWGRGHYFLEDCRELREYGRGQCRRLIFNG